MNFKVVLLTVASCILIFMMYSSDFYNKWYDTRVANISEDKAYIEDHNTIYDRNLKRFGGVYSSMMQAKKVINAAVDSNKAKYGHPVVLLPPRKFLKENGVDVPIPEPIVFYYFTGLKSVWTTSSNVMDANWVITAANGQLYVKFIENKAELNNYLTAFKPYPPSI